MAGAPQGGTTTNASSFSLNEDIKLPMGGRYQPASSVGVFGGPQTNNGMMMDLNPESPTNGQMIPRGGPRQATPNPNAQGFDSFRSNAGLPQPMALNSGVQQMAAPQQGGYNVNAMDMRQHVGDFPQMRISRDEMRPAMPFTGMGGVETTRGPMPTVTQPMAQGGYNVNTASAQGLQQAQQGAAAGMGYRPMAITAPSQAGLQQYTNPYESQVVQQSLDDLERSRLMAQNVGGAQASAANAFGGSRQGIAEAETNRAFADQAARTASGLRQTGYQNAQTMERQAQMQNQQAGLSGAQQRLNAGQQLGSLSNLGFGMGQTIQNRMDQQGAMQQALNQQLINAGKQQYAGYTGAPAQSLQYLLQAVGGAPASGSATETYDAGLFDYLTLGAKAYASNPAKIGSMFGFGG